MNTHEVLFNLIKRMMNRNLEFIPEMDGSMYVTAEQAYKEAKTLDNPTYIEPIKQLIEKYSSNSTKDKDIRRRAYYLLEQFAVNTGSNEIFDYFADRLAVESDKDLLADCLLLYFYSHSYLPLLEKLLLLLENQRSQVRNMVIKLLGAYPREEVEDILMRKLKQAHNSSEISHLLVSLGRIRSTKMRELLDSFFHHEKAEVRSSAVTAARMLGGQNFLHQYKEALKDRSREVKLTALYAILEHGDESVIDVVIERLKVIIKSKRKIEPVTAKDSELVIILQFLLKFKGERKVAAIVEWIQEKKWENLFVNEREWIETHWI